MKRLVLLGGGHTHVEIIRRFGATPLPDTRIVVVSPERHTLYSGMLPGFVAGHYDFNDCHIDLAPLCRLAGAEFHTTQASGIDAAVNRVLCADGAAIDYDVLSIDIGSTPHAESIPGALEHATPVKPVAAFMRTWDRIRSTAWADDRPLSIVVVGGARAAWNSRLQCSFACRPTAPHTRFPSCFACSPIPRPFCRLIRPRCGASSSAPAANAGLRYILTARLRRLNRGCRTGKALRRSTLITSSWL